MEYFLAFAAALGAWWLSTIVILYRAGMPAATFGRTLAGASVAALLGSYAIVVSLNDATPAGAYLAFFGGIALFGWHEVSYLFGFVSGPRPEACPEHCNGWTRFGRGVQTCLYHEIAVVLTVLAVALLTWSAPNQIALWTLSVLWLMRWSAKLNIFLGVPNLHVEFWPAHLAYLKSYTRSRSMNGLFPWSIIVSTTVVTLLAVLAANSPPGSGARTGTTLVATLLALATIEHWFLIVRLPDELLWQPGLRSRRTSAQEAASASGS